MIGRGLHLHLRGNVPHLVEDLDEHHEVLIGTGPARFSPVGPLELRELPRTTLILRDGRVLTVASDLRFRTDVGFIRAGSLPTDILLHGPRMGVLEEILHSDPAPLYWAQSLVGLEFVLEGLGVGW